MIGTILANRYTILEEIGDGGMAIVYKAHDRLLNRDVAVKVLRAEFNSDEEFVKRFDIEAQAAASLNHPNIISIYDVGHQNNIHFIVMEIVVGPTLKRFIQEKGALPYRQALDFSMQICAALEHAHSKHIIHRDIKPQNMIVSDNGQIKVTDFGIARATVSSTTKLGSVMGSAHYLSPEQARGGFTDERSDIYSLGICMYEMFTGTLPFDGDNAVSVAMQHLQKTPEPPKSVNPAIPKSIETIILKAMNKEQRLRYANAGELMEDLEKVSVNPRMEIEVEQEPSDIFSTQKIPTLADVPIKQTAPRSQAEPADEQEAPVRKTQGSKKKGGQKGPVIAAVISTLLLVGILGFGVFKLVQMNQQENLLEVPNLVEMTVEEAKAKLVEEELEFVIVEAQSANNDTVEKDKIFKQEPKAGTSGKKGQEIMVYVSLGPKSYELLDYSSWEYSDVKKDLDTKKINIERKDEDSTEFPEGVVIRTVPGKNAQVKAGDTVTVYVSKGEGDLFTPVPDLLGYSQREAQDRLEANGLVLGKTDKKKSDTVAAGLVIDQSIPKDTQVAKNTVVDIVVSDGKAQPVEKKFSFYVTSDAENVKVTIKEAQTGVVVYNKSHKAGDFVEVALKDTGVHKYVVYYDDTENSNFTINFDE